MSKQTSPKLESFRALVQQAASIHTDISTYEAAIRDRDAIRQRMADSADEAEAHKHLDDLTRVEQSITVKKVRLPRQKGSLADILSQTTEAFLAAHPEVEALVMAASKDATAAFRHLLHAVQLDTGKRDLERANPVVIAAIRTHALAMRQEDILAEAWRAGSISIDSPPKWIERFQVALACLDKALAAHADIVAEDKRLASACAAFLEVYGEH